MTSIKVSEKALEPARYSVASLGLTITQMP
jgi:hypothetical protein